MTIKVNIVNNKYDDLGRYFYILIKILSKFSQHVIVYNKPWIKTELYSKFIFDLENVKIIDNNTDIKSDIYLTDLKIPNTKNININNGIWKKDRYLPVMHPNIYNLNFNSLINTFRNNHQNIGIFFAGNTNANIYYSINNLLNRFLLANLAKKHQSYKNIKSIEDLQSNLLDKIIILEKNNLKIPNNNWLKYLSLAKFFLSLPGSKTEKNYSFCKNGINYVTHNTIEAMSVGSIPILSNHEIFSKNPLQNKHNCLIYNSPRKMIEAINYALQMPEEERLFMRNNVINYYNNYLDTSKIFEKIIE